MFQLALNSLATAALGSFSIMTISRIPSLIVTENAELLNTENYVVTGAAIAGAMLFGLATENSYFAIKEADSKKRSR